MCFCVVKAAYSVEIVDVTWGLELMNEWIQEL